MGEYKTEFVGLREAAQLAGVSPWKISYALAAGYLTEPPRVAGKRAFDPEAIERSKVYFGVKKQAAR